MNVSDALKNRRSINFFDPEKPVDENELYKIIETANYSPSSFNLQPWEVVLVTDPERKAALRKCAFNQAKVEEAPATLIVIANPNAVEENVDRVISDFVEHGYNKKEEATNLHGMPFNLYLEKDSLTRKIFAVKNTAFFAMSFMLAAKGYGYETHPMDGFNEAQVKKEFNIPEDRIIPLLIAVGHPKPGMKLLPPKFRRSIKEFVKKNMF